MNRLKIFFRYATSIAKIAALMTAVSATAAVESYSDKEMTQLLEKFPQLHECTVEQREEAFLFYKEAQEVRALLAEASKAIEASNIEQTQEKVAEATEILQQMQKSAP